MKEIKIAGRAFRLPQSRLLRTILGVLLILGGLLGFLPVVGFWMLPLGLLILSVDSPTVRRWRRQADVAIRRWWHARRKGPNT